MLRGALSSAMVAIAVVALLVVACSGPTEDETRPPDGEGASQVPTASPLTPGSGPPSASIGEPASADGAGTVEIFITGWNAVVHQIGDEWTISFAVSFQAIGGPTPPFGISYAVCERPVWCGPDAPHEFGQDILAESGLSTVQNVTPLAELEQRFVGGPTVVSWQGPDPTGKHFLARIDSTETVAEGIEENNGILVFICEPPASGLHCATVP